MPRRSLIGAGVLALAMLGCGLLSWRGLSIQPSRFIVPGAQNVQMRSIGPGTRVISYDIADPSLSWDGVLDQRLRAAHWLPPDFSGAPAQYTIYTYVNMFWFGAIWQEVNLTGSNAHATITLRRWLRVRWWPGYALYF